jgi:hypothetical protein
MRKPQQLALPRDVARLLNCSPEQVCLLADRGELPLLGRTPRGVRIFRIADVEGYLAERKAKREPVRRGRSRPLQLAQ